MKKVLVTGANGQLGKCLQDVCLDFTELEMLFVSKNDLDIENEEALEAFFRNNQFDYCINTAAYTHVDKAESEPEKAFSTNAEAVKNLSLQCSKWGVVLLHISTDYVFDGNTETPYCEGDTTNPINVYGSSKLKGEEYIQEFCEKYYIIRTSWLYSQYGKNFMTYILNVAKEDKPMTITTEQIGSPTNANDLARVLLKIVDSKKEDYGIYHFSNQGETTWYGFAKEILKISNQFDDSKLVKTDHYSTFAKRPRYSVLDNSKIKLNFSITPNRWESSIKTKISK